ncbi:MAG: hypothetical protein AB1896_20465 [Thermodesulfobacteriota bacterium]
MARYRLKRGVGKHVYQGRVYLPGDIVEAAPENMKGVLDKFDLLDPPDQAQAEAKQPNALKMVHKGFGRYDVLNTTSGQILNDHLLKKAEALALVEGSSVPQYESQSPAEVPLNAGGE